MTWFKVDDSFHSHPKAMAAGPAAVGLWTIAGSWSNANLTDGFVPDYMLPRFAQDAPELALTLVAAGLWRRAKGGYRYHDWGDYQPTRESVLTERKKWADKKAKQRAGKKDEDSNSSSGTALSLGDTPGDSPGESSPSRTRSRSRTSSYEEVLPDDSLRSSSPPSRGATRGARIPDDFAVTPDMIEWAKTNTPHVGARETEAFVDYFRSAPGVKGVKLDWRATWRNWMRRAENDSARAPTGRGARTLVEHNGLRLKPETVANLEGRARFEAMDQQQLAIEGTAS